MFRKLSKRGQADLSMVIVSFIWGVSFVLVKDALADIGPFVFVGFRFMLAFLVLAALSYRDVLKLHGSTIGYGCLLGFFLFIGYAFQTVGLKYTTSSNAGFVTGVSVVLVPIMDSLLYKKKPSLATVITVTMAALGLFLISVPLGSIMFSQGDSIVLVGAFGFAVHIILVDAYSHQHNAIAITAIQILVVGVLCTAIGSVVETIPVRITLNAMSAIIVTAVLSTALAFLVQNYMQRFSTPTHFAVVLTLEPVFAALAGYIWAGDRLSGSGLFGCGLILLAMLITVLFRKKPATPI
jgi:Predicted permease, DMT superfamily